MASNQAPRSVWLVIIISAVVGYLLVLFTSLDRTRGPSAPSSAPSTVSTPPSPTAPPPERPAEAPAIQTPPPATSGTPRLGQIETPGDAARPSSTREQARPAQAPDLTALPPVSTAAPRSAEPVSAAPPPPVETATVGALPVVPTIGTPDAIPGLAPSAPLPRSVAPPEAGIAPSSKVFDSESAALVAIVKDYERAYDRLDATAAAAVWPSVDERALARAFARLQMQNLDFGDCTFAVSHNEATAQCAGVIQYAQRIGDTTTKNERHVWTIEFVRATGGWRIARVTAR